MRNISFHRSDIVGLLRVIAFLFAMGLPKCSVAQKGVVYVGMHAGIGMSSFQPIVKYPRDFYFCPSPGAGLLVSYNLGDVIALNGALNYVSIRTRRDGMLPFAYTPLSARFPKNYYGFFTEQIRADYLELPLTIDGAIGSRYRLVCGVGVFVAVRLGAINTTSGRSYIYTDSTGTGAEPISSYQVQDLTSRRDITGSTRLLNFGGVGHVGMSRSLGHGRVGVDARCAFGASDAWRQPSRPNVGKTLMLAIDAMYTIPCVRRHSIGDN